MTNGNRRRMSLLILALCLMLIAGIVAQIWMSLHNERNIEYGASIVTPEPPQACPGDKFTYPLDIMILYGNSVSRITEGWCRGDGICPIALQNTPYFVNFVEPYSVSLTATRTVPDGLSPGVWELRHCNETHSNNLIDVQCYAVPLTVLDCAP